MLLFDFVHLSKRIEMNFVPPYIDWLENANSWRWEHNPSLRNLYVELLGKQLNGEIEYIDFLVFCGINAIRLTKEEYKAIKDSDKTFKELGG